MEPRAYTKVQQAWLSSEASRESCVPGHTLSFWRLLRALGFLGSWNHICNLCLFNIDFSVFLSLLSMYSPLPSAYVPLPKAKPALILRF